MLESQVHPQKRVSRRRMRKTKAREKLEASRKSLSLRSNSGTCLCLYKNRSTPRGMIVGFPASVRRPHFFPFLILNSYAHLRPLRMSGAHVFENARDIAFSGGTFYTANTVSGTATYLLSKLMVWISGRSTSTAAIGRCPMASLPLCQIRAIGSQDVQKPLPDSRGIFLPTQMVQLRIESSFCCTVWGVLERLRFA